MKRIISFENDYTAVDKKSQIVIICSVFASAQIKQKKRKKLTRDALKHQRNKIPAQIIGEKNNHHFLSNGFL